MEGQQSDPLDITVVFDRICTQGAGEDNRLTVPTDVPAENLMICTSVPSITITVDGQIPLTTLSNIQVKYFLN